MSAFRFNPVVSDDIAVPAEVAQGGVRSVRVRMLSQSHTEKIQYQSLLAIPQEAFDRVRDMGSIEKASDPATVKEAKRRNAREKAKHPSFGMHLGATVKYGVVRVNDTDMSPVDWDAQLENVPKTLLRWMADEVASFSGLNESDDELGEG